MRTLVFSAAMALAAIGCSKSEQDPKSEIEPALPEISVDQVSAGLEAKTLTAVDCNGDKTRKRSGVLPGAILLVPDEETFTADLLPADKATKLVFYCGGPG